jgi:hypothetical protein
MEEMSLSETLITTYNTTCHHYPNAHNQNTLRLNNLSFQIRVTSVEWKQHERRMKDKSTPKQIAAHMPRGKRNCEEYWREVMK